MNDQIDDAVDDSQNRLFVRMAIGGTAVAGTVFLSIGGWIFAEVLESRQFRLSGDRYTQQDAARDRADLIERLSSFRLDMERLKVALERVEKGM